MISNLRGGERLGKHYQNGRPRRVVLAGGIANVDHVTSPSSSVQSMGGVLLGRCCRPSSASGYRAACGCRGPSSSWSWTHMSCRALHAPPRGKRSRSSRVTWSGSASPPRVAKAAHARASSLALRAPQLARDLLSVTFGSPSTPLSAGRLRMLLLFCFHGASGNAALQVQISIASCRYDRHSLYDWDSWHYRLLLVRKEATSDARCAKPHRSPTRTRCVAPRAA
jgi:hypothetical protein